MDWKIGEKVIVYQEGVIEKIEDSFDGIKIQVRYPNDKRSKLLGDGFAWVYQDIVKKADKIFLIERGI